MSRNPPKIEQSARLIGEFIDRHQIPYSRFELLRSRRPFSSLTERRVRDWAPLPGMRLKNRKAQVSTARWLAELAAWIQRDERGLLNRLKIEPQGLIKRDAVEKSKQDAALHQRETMPFPSIGQTALELAGQGYRDAGMALALRGFSRAAGHAPEQAIRLLSSIIYLLYRYYSPHEIAKHVEGLCEQIHASEICMECDPIGRDLAVAQIACALNERGQGSAAQQLFSSPELRVLCEGSTNGTWQPQLLRNVAVYWALHGHRTSEALALVAQADQLAPASLSNLRAGATVRCQTLFGASKSQRAKAWESIEPYYAHAREILIPAAQSNNLVLSDVLHLYSGLYYGALARSVAGKGYASRKQLDEDAAALRWCQFEFGPIQIDDALVELPSKRTANAIL